MPYRFEQQEKISSAVKRIANEQIEKAIRGLQSKKDKQRGIHETRKAYKRIRSLLTLIRPTILKKIYTSENERLRTLSRTLAAQRDIHVMMQTMTFLQSHDHANRLNEISTTLKSILHARAIEIENQKSPGLAVEQIEILRRAKKDFSKLPMKGVSIEKVLEGFKKTYAKSQSRMQSAYEELDADHFHNWRKSLQRHWRQQKLLTRVGPKSLTERIEKSRELAEILGTHNDIDVLQSFVVRELPDQIATGQADGFFKICESQMNSLRAKARPLGEELFSQSPKQITKQVKTGWKKVC